MRQTILTIITAIDPAKREQLEAMLTAIRCNLVNNSYISFSSLTLLHFASFTIFDCSKNLQLLIFENNFDGNLSDYLDQILSVSGKGINEIYQCCIGCQTDIYQPNSLKSFLVANVVRPNAYHIGNVGRTAKTIGDNAMLREELQTYLDNLFSQTKPNHILAIQLRKNMQSFVRSNVISGLYALPPPHQTLLERVIPWFRLSLVVTFFLGLFPVDIILLLLLRFKESNDLVNKELQVPSVINKLMSVENEIPQNHLTVITKIKSGLFRLLTLKVVLFAVNLLARISTKGKLSGIPSIHFAHWSIINNKYLLFLSNYDGSWSSYLDDFIDKASPGLTGIWSNTVEFPKTRFLVFDGARDEPAFKAFARSMQIPSLVWYSAYPDLTVQNIDKDSSIREDLFTDFSQIDTDKWLKLF